MTEIKYMENFPFETLKFLRNLAKNNNRNWFESHRSDYEEKFLKPAQVFVEHVGLLINDVNPNIIADPRVDKSIFRLHRDVRFSKNKVPYKTNMGLLFWEGSGKKMESSGLYFHVDPKNYFVATGMYTFTKDQLTKYRNIISIEKNAEELDSIIKKIIKKGYLLGGKHYKKIPRGFDKEYQFADMLLYNGLYAFKEQSVDLLTKTDPVKFVLKTFKELEPLHQWLVLNLPAK